MGDVMKKLLLGTIALVALNAGSSALAADMSVKAPLYKAPPLPVCGYSDITAANSQINVDYATTHVDYVEFSPGPPFAPGVPRGTPLDSEKGWVPGVSVTGSAMFNVGSLCNVYVLARISYFKGHTDYWQVPPGPLGTSDAKLWEQDFRVGKGFELAPNVMLTPYLGGGLRRWDREVGNGGPSAAGTYHEDYEHGYLGAGLMLQVSPISRLVLSASGLVGGTIGSQLNGHPVPGGTPFIVPFHTALGNSTIYKVEGSADYAFTQNIHANVGVEWTNFNYGQSAPFVADIFGGSAVEPSSRTNIVTVRAGLGFAFGYGPIVAKN
jgi:opacity protein-like surface antigen